MCEEEAAVCIDAQDACTATVVVCRQHAPSQCAVCLNNLRCSMSTRNEAMTAVYCSIHHARMLQQSYLHGLVHVTLRCELQLCEKGQVGVYLWSAHADFWALLSSC